MFGQLVLMVAAALIGPLLAASRRPLVPVLLGELLAGIVIGRTGLHLLDAAAQPFPVFSALGLAMLMLSAGTDVDLHSVAIRRAIPRGAIALAIAAAASIPVGALIAVVLRVEHAPLLVILLAGSSAAIAFPIFEERHLTGSAIALLMVWITLADAVTAVVMPLTIIGPARIAGALLGDAVIVVVTVGLIALGRRMARRYDLARIERQSIERRWALRLRLSVLLLLILAAIAERTGGSLLVAGFAAGMVLRLFREPHRLALQLSGLANGFFIPAFFVLLGATLDLRELVRLPAAIALTFAMPIGSVLVHTVGAALAQREQRINSGLLASAQLGLPAAAASLGLTAHVLTPALAAALVAGGCLTLLPASIGALRFGEGTPEPT